MYCVWATNRNHTIWALKGRSRGRPRETWRRTVETERQKMGFTTWSEVVAAASDKTVCRR